MEKVFECPACKAKSYNVNDIANQYCHACKVFYRVDPEGTKVILTSMQQCKTALLSHADGLVRAAEFNTLIGAMHDMEILLRGLLADQIYKKDTAQ